MKRFIQVLAVTMLLGIQVRAEPRPRPTPLSKEEVVQIVYDQKLGATIPRNLNFTDDQGHPVAIGDYLGRTPMVLVLGYYRCPMLCGLVSAGLAEVIGKVPLRIGRDYQVVQVSIDPREGPPLAAAKKKSYLQRLSAAGESNSRQPARGLPSFNMDEAANGWHLLTGSVDASGQLAAAVGFQYRYDSKAGEYAHPPGLVIVTPAGRISQYLLGVSFDPEKLASALRTASEDRLGSPVERLWMLCYHVLPVGGLYGPAAMATLRVLAFLFLVGLVVLIVRLMRRERVDGSEEKG